MKYHPFTLRGPKSKRKHLCKRCGKTKRHRVHHQAIVKALKNFENEVRRENKNKPHEFRARKSRKPHLCFWCRHTRRHKLHRDWVPPEGSVERVAHDSAKDIVGVIAQRMAKKSPFIDLLTRRSFPKGAGDSIKIETKELFSDRRQEGGDHYKRCAVQPFDLIKAMESSGNTFADYSRGCVIKYAFRKKGSHMTMAEDLRKAAHYAVAAAEVLEAEFRKAAASFTGYTSTDAL